MEDVRVVEAVIEAPCWVLHRLWWLPIWNRSLLLNCPIAWACNRSARFAAWYWQLPITDFQKGAR